MGNVGNMHPEHAATTGIGLQRKRIVIIPGRGRVNGKNEPIAEIPAITRIGQAFGLSLGLPNDFRRKSIPQLQWPGQRARGLPYARSVLY